VQREDQIRRRRRRLHDHERVEIARAAPQVGARAVIGDDEERVLREIGPDREQQVRNRALPRRNGDDDGALGASLAAW